MIPTATISGRVINSYVGRMPWPKTGATIYDSQIGLLRQWSCNQRVGNQAHQIWYREVHQK